MKRLMALWIVCVFSIRPVSALSPKETLNPLHRVTECGNTTTLPQPVATSVGRQELPQSPMQVQAFLQSLTGTWCHTDKSSKDILNITWNTGRDILTIHRQRQRGDQRRSWTEFWFWNGVSENGACSSHGCRSLGFSTPLNAQTVYPESALLLHGSRAGGNTLESIMPLTVNGKSGPVKPTEKAELAGNCISAQDECTSGTSCGPLPSDTVKQGLKTMGNVGNLMNVTFRIESNGPNQFTWRDTHALADGKNPQDGTRVFARSCLPVTLDEI